MSDGILSGLSPKARGKVETALRSDKTKRLVADAIESRSEGMLSRHECESIAGGVVAVLAGCER